MARVSRVKSRIGPPDYTLLFIVLALLAIGFFMMISIGVPKSIDLSPTTQLYPNCNDADVDCYLLLKKHSSRMVIGILAMIVCAKIPYRIWKKLATPFLGLTMLLLWMLIIAGQSYGTIATSWLTVFNTSLQPTEFAKLALIFYFAYWMEKKSREIETFEYGFLPFCLVLTVMLIPILLQPDLGSALVVSAICVSIYFIGGARIRHIMLGSVIAVLLASLAVNIEPHAMGRVKSFFTPIQECDRDLCWQSMQANIAIGSGGFWGKGLTQGVQKELWLPQATDDFIFAASAEEIGFYRIVPIVLLYMFFAFRGYKIAIYAPNKFGRLVAAGITSWITVQAFINMAVNVSLFPITGITLPFISYGGSSMLATLIAVGVLLNISKYLPSYAYNSNRGRNRRSHNSQYRSYKSLG